MVPKEIWKSDLWQLICACVVEPSAVGFNMGDVEIMKNLPQEVGCYWLLGDGVVSSRGGG